MIGAPQILFYTFVCHFLVGDEPSFYKEAIEIVERINKMVASHE